MKIRTGFVSNSSSSSFVVYGVSMDVTDLRNILIKLGEKPEEVENWGSWDCGDALVGHLGKGWAVGGPSDWDERMVGRTYQSMDDDETAKQFKDSVKVKLTELLGKEVQPAHIEEGWYDG